MRSRHEDSPMAPANEWQTNAPCRNSLLFVTALHESAEQRHDRENAAKQVCRACPVQCQCLDYALHVDERLGVWGGTNGRERLALQRR
jgi:WhiB family transcriptional regulator, redox-sensing transcriptional regulator